MFPPIPTGQPEDDLAVTGNSMRDMLATVSAKTEEDQGPSDDDKLLQRAQDDFRQVVSWEQSYREKAEEELKFVDALDHWDPAMKEERNGRPCLVFDRIGPSFDQVVNDARQNPPEPQVAPIGAGADKDTADVLQGLLRNIDQDSGAVIAYLTGYEHAVKIGRGWWRLHFEFENDATLDHDAFHQKIVIKRVRNPFSVYPDPSAQEFDYSDMTFCFVTEDVSLNQFKRDWPESITAGYSSFEGVGDKIVKDWFPRGCVRVAEYWWVETTEEEICQLNDGAVMRLAEIPEGAVIVNRRKRKLRKVKGAKITGNEVLERWDWPGKFIPIVPVLGKEIFKDGRITLRGMVRPAMDSNLSFDYMMSKQVETVGLSSIVQWMVAEGQIENYEYQWAQANRKALPFLEYKTEVGGKPVPPPTRIFGAPPLGAISESIAHMDEATKMNLSTWQPSLGDAPASASGKAITARVRESDNAHFNYHDNFMRSMRHSCRIELDLIPHVYSEERMITVLNPDGTNKQVMVNRAIVEKGIQKIFDTKAATRCDVTVGSGPSYASRRQEGADKLMQIAPYVPQIIQRAPDLLVMALDVPDGDQIADRIRPPDVQADTEGQAPLPPQIQSLIQQQHQMIGTLTAHVQALDQTLKAKVLDIEAKERMNARDNMTRIVTAGEASKNAVGQKIAEMAHEHVQNELDRRLELTHDDRTVEQEAQPPAPPAPGALPAAGPAPAPGEVPPGPPTPPPGPAAQA